MSVVILPPSLSVRSAKLTIRMLNNLNHPRLPPNLNLPPHLLPNKPRRNHQLPSPPLVPLTMRPKHPPSKRTVRLRGIPDEASRGVRVHGQQEHNV